MSIIRSILRGFSYQLGKFIFFIIVALIIIYLVKGSGISWEDIVNRLFYF